MSIGCIYVPLNPADPVERLAYLINDINAPIILTQTHLAEKVNSAIGVAAAADTAPNDNSVPYNESNSIRNNNQDGVKLRTAIPLDNFMNNNSSFTAKQQAASSRSHRRRASAAGCSLYSDSILHEMKQSNPTMKSADLATLMLNQWNKLSSADKQTYNDQANKNAINDSTRQLPLVEIDSNSVAYVIYTSGSTGKPKGVELSHYNFLYILECYLTPLPVVDSPSVLCNLLLPTDIVINMGSCTFDVHVMELVGTVLAGAGVVILDAELYRDLDYVSSAIKKNSVTIFPTVPSYARAIVEINQYWERLVGLRALQSFGEALSADLCRKYLLNLSNIQVHNLYGPAETNVATYHCCSNQWKCDHSSYTYSTIPIGQPFPCYNVFILDKTTNQLTIPGEEGVLFISGPGLFKGYLNQHEITKRSLSTKYHITKHKDKLLYNTGDLVKLLPNNELLYVQRSDHQVKLRGQRLEVGEIENTIIASNSSVLKQCIVVKHVGANHGEYLAAYYTIAKDCSLAAELFQPNSKSLKEFHFSISHYCQAKLQAYMIPSAYILLAEFPLNNNGKIDRKQLVAPTSNDFLIASEEFVAPSNDWQRCIQQVYSVILKKNINEISCAANFFSLGGDSLLAMQAVPAINKLIHNMKNNNHIITIQHFLQYSTVNSLAHAIQHSESIAGDAAPAIPSNLIEFSRNVDNCSNIQIFPASAASARFLLEDLFYQINSGLCGSTEDYCYKPSQITEHQIAATIQLKPKNSNNSSFNFSLLERALLNMVQLNSTLRSNWRVHINNVNNNNNNNKAASNDMKLSGLSVDQLINPYNSELLEQFKRNPIRYHLLNSPNQLNEANYLKQFIKGFDCPLLRCDCILIPLAGSNNNNSSQILTNLQDSHPRSMKVIDVEHFSAVILYFQSDHIVLDGLALGVFLEQLFNTYTNLSQDQQGNIISNYKSINTINYCAYSEYERNNLFQSNQYKQSLSYWKEYLAPIKQLEQFNLLLPSINNNDENYFNEEWSLVNSTVTNEIGYYIPHQIIDSINQFSRANGISLFNVWLSLLQLFFHKLLNVNLISIAAANENRYLAEFQSILGQFVNTVPYCCQFNNSSNISQFHELCAGMSAMNLSHYCHSYVPMENIMKQAQTTKLWQCFFDYANVANHLDNIVNNCNGFINNHVTPTIQCATNSIIFPNNSLKQRITQFPLEIQLTQLQGKYSFKIAYDNEKYSRQQVEGLLGRFRIFCTNLIQRENFNCKALDLLNNQEINAIQAINANQSEEMLYRAVNSDIPTQFQQALIMKSNHLAVQLDEITLTYQQLHSKVYQLAHFMLNKLKIKSASYIGQCVDRSIEMIIGILAIMSIGCIYVPLNPADPVDRLAYLINDINAPIILTQSGILDKVEQSIGQAQEERRKKNSNDNNSIKQLTLDDFQYNSNPHQNDVKGKKELPLVPIASNSIAYVIYTSGSTGLPKGAQLYGRSILNSIYSFQALNYLYAECALIQTAACTFDQHVMEIIGPLVSGGSVIMIKPQGNLDLDYYSNTIAKKNVDLMIAVPSFYSALIAHCINNHLSKRFSAIKIFQSGGEQLTYNHIQKLLSINKAAKVVNVYGPAECTDAATYYEYQLPNDKATVEDNLLNQPVPIGKSLYNYQCYILDENRQLVLPGAVGELYIGGCGVFAGYINNKQLSDQILINLPYISNDNKPLYKTGDLVKLLPSGQMLFIGRQDFQVKLRGQRLEVGEIENVIIQSNPQLVKQCVVIKLIHQENKAEYLAAYLTLSNVDVKDSNSTSQLKLQVLNSCKEKLQAYMIPSAFVVLEQFPLNNNGKVDRKLLVSPLLTDFINNPAAASQHNEFVAPTTELQLLLATAYSQVLNVGKISIHQDLFSLGKKELCPSKYKSQSIHICVLIRNLSLCLSRSLCV
jgi:amino acid adenylation domain-containing protein